MLFITLFLLIFVAFIKSPSVVRNIPLRTDHYESLSNPIFCIEISHYNPTGPLYLYATFYYNRYSTLQSNETKSKYSVYAFKRVSRTCKTSIIYTTLGNDFQKLKIIMTIYLSMKIGFLAEFDYTFYEGFSPGIYELLDVNKKFIIRVKILNESKNYFNLPVILEEVDKSHIKSIDTKNSEICVITDNNHGVVLKPAIDSTLHIGFIIGLHAEIFKNGLRFGERNYSAYACHKHKFYPDIPTVFIIDREEFKVKLNVIYRQYFTDSKDYIKEFEVSNYKFDYINNFKNISLKCNKVFLIKFHTKMIYCKDGSWAVFYLSEYGTRYFMIVKKEIRILSFVEFIGKIYRSKHDPCGEISKKEK